MRAVLSGAVLWPFSETEISVNILMQLLISIFIHRIIRGPNCFCIARAIPVTMSVLFCMLCYQKTFAGCTGTPSYNVNLTGHPDTTWTSPSTTRSGSCCSSSNCVHFTLTLDSNAGGVIFSVSGGAGGTHYIINCDSTGSAGAPYCLTGTGPWEIDFCKPGGNSQTYTFQSYSRPRVLQKTVYITNGCFATLSVKGLTTSTITWTSLSGSTYNSRLSCTSACTTTNVSTGASFPSYVNYEVCGTPLLSCYGSFCDTIKVVYVSPVSVLISPKPASVCSGDSLKLTATISGGKSPYTYLWNNGSTSSFIYGKTSGKYKVTVKDSLGCISASDSVTLTVNPLPAAATISNSTICSGSSISIGTTAVGGSSYAWVSSPSGFTSTSSNPTASPTVTTTYTLTETNSNGCVKSNSVTVTVIPLTVSVSGSPLTVCIGNTVTLTASAPACVSYQWSNTGGQIPGATSSTYGATTSGTYYVTVKNGSASATSLGTIVIINPLAGASVIANTAICTGQSINIGGSAVLLSTYSWTSSTTGGTVISTSANPSVSPSTTTTYTVVETYLLGCPGTNSVTITVNALPAASVIANTAICAGASLPIGASSVGGSTYSWISSPSGFTSTSSNPTVSPIATTTYTLTETNSNGCVKSNSVIITVNPVPSASVVSNTAVCSGTSISIGASGTAGHTYSWVSAPLGFTSTSSNPSAAPVVSTTYTLTETITATGCSKLNSVTITAHALPAASVIANTAICIGASLPIGGSAVGGSTYFWVSVPLGFVSTSSNPTASPVVTTSYTLTETNSNGCVKSNSVTITVNALPAASVIASTAICIGASVSIGASAVGGSTYSWVSVPLGFASTSSNPTASPVITTAYTLTETNSNGCVKSNSVTITVNALPAASVIANTAICIGASLPIGGSAVGGSTYSWVSVPLGFASSSSNPTASPVITTAYTLTETNSNGCVKSNSVTITVNALPAASVIANTAICIGGSLPIGGSAVGGSTYSWVSVPLGFASTSSNPTASPVVTTAYTLTETNSNGCVKSNSVTITVNALPAASVIANTAICISGSLPIGASAVGGSTYSWVSVPLGFASTSSNPTASPVITTSYTLTETNSNGCVKSNSVSITVNALPAASVIANTAICIGASLPIGGSAVGGSTYSWVSVPLGFVSTSSNPTASPVITTAYTLTETNSNGCVKSNSVTITVNALPAASVIANTAICIGASLPIGASAVGGSTYSWVSVPLGFASTSSNPTASPVITTAYTLTETNSNGCVKSNSVTITVNALPAASVIANTAICIGGSLPIGGSAVGGSTYSWVSVPLGFASTSSNPTSSPSVTTAYTLTETNSNGCIKSNSVTITVNALPAASVIANTAICIGASLPIGASAVGGSTYSWVSAPLGFTSTSSNPTASPVINISYTLTETNSNGCVKSNSVTITVNVLPTASVIANTAICTGASLPIGASAIGGSTYSWVSVPLGFASTSSNPTASPVITTAYTLTETNSNGCVKSNSVTITVNVLPTASVIANTAICTGGSLPIGGSAVGGSTYSWVSIPLGFVSTSSNPTASPVSTTAYTLTETNSNGCVKSNSVTITVHALPASSVIANTAICIGTSLPIGASAVGGSTYSWASVPLGFVSTSSNPTASPVITTAYTLTETNSNGCVKSNSVSITVNVLPAASVIASTAICIGASLPIGGSAVGGSTYSWVSVPLGFVSTSSNPTASPVITTAYTLTETNSNGCVKSNSVSITVNVLPAASVIANTAICIGGSLPIGASAVGGSTYSWVSVPSGFTSTSSNPTSSPSVTTAYSLTETNSNGCMKSNSVSITVNPLPNPSILGNSSTCENVNSNTYSTAGNIGDTYSWSTLGGSIQSGQGTNFIVINWSGPGPGIVTVTETSPQGCLNTVQYNVTIYSKPGIKLVEHW